MKDKDTYKFAVQYSSHYTDEMYEEFFTTLREALQTCRKLILRFAKDIPNKSLEPQLALWEMDGKGLYVDELLGLDYRDFE